MVVFGVIFLARRVLQHSGINRPLLLSALSPLVLAGPCLAVPPPLGSSGRSPAAGRSRSSTGTAPAPAGAEAETLSRTTAPLTNRAS